MRRWILIGFVFSSVSVWGQTWTQMMQDPNANFYDIKAKFEQEWQGERPSLKGEEEENEEAYGYRQFMRWAAYMEPRVYPTGKLPQGGKFWEAYQTFHKRYAHAQNLQKDASNWQPLGPISWNSIGWNPGLGRVNFVCEDPNDSSRIYVGTPAGGLWRSDDSGQSWTPLTDQLPSLGASAVVVDPNNSNIIYLGTGDDDAGDSRGVGVLKSTDGGQTWALSGLSYQVSQNISVRQLLMSPVDHHVLLCATNQGLFKTTDGGVNWINVIHSAIWDVKFQPGNTDIVYASNKVIYRSTDGGDNFDMVPETADIPDSINRTFLAVTPADPNRVYALRGSSNNNAFYGLYESTNEGVSFTRKSDSPNIFGYPGDGTGGGGQSWYDMAICASPTNPDRVVIGGINDWQSLDGGVTWQNLTTWTYPSDVGYTHADIHYLGFYGNRLYCGSDGGVFRKTPGNNWQDLTEGLQITEFYRFDYSHQQPNIMIAGSQDNGTSYFSADLTNLHVLGGDGCGGLMDPTDDQVMYSSYPQGGIQISVNGGQNFSDFINNQIQENGDWVTPMELIPGHHDEMIACFQNVWKHTNANGWQQLSDFGLTQSLKALAIAPSDSLIMFTSSQNQLFRTTDGGADWQDLTNNLPNYYITSIAIDPNDPANVWITYSGYNSGEKIYKSTNAGDTWENISLNLPNLPANCITVDGSAQHGLYIGTDAGIYYKNDDLSNWQPFSNGLPKCRINQIRLISATNKVRAATFGRGIWESSQYTPESTPPIVSFSKNTVFNCTLDSIHFTDLSLNATSQRLWTFESGTPATSTAYSPSVIFPGPGIYTVTLQETTQFGTSSHSEQVNIPATPNHVIFKINTDSYGQETSWDIRDSSNQILFSGGPFGNGVSIVRDSICMPDGCYYLNVYDSYGDGMCCAYGNGYFLMTNLNGDTLANGGQFTNQVTDTICFSSDTPSGIQAITKRTRQFSVYPNPSNGRFHLRISDEIQAPWNIRLYSATGALVGAWKESSAKIDNAYSLPGAAPGLYHLVILHGNATYEKQIEFF